MTFLNPLVLFGLAAAAIPVILHLLNLRKLRTIEFSTLTFLKELQQTKIRKLKLRQLLLLLVRTLLVIFIILAFARPALRGTILGSIGTNAHSTVIFIFDDSFSELAADDHGERFKQAKDATLKLIDLLKEGDEAFLIKLSDLPKATIEPAAHDVSVLRTAINESRVSFIRHPLEEGLNLASRLLMQSHNVNKEIYIISDMQQTLFTFNQRSQELAPLFDEHVTFFRVPVGKKNIANATIDSVEVTTKILEKEKPVHIYASVRNFNNLPLRDDVVSVFLDGVRVAQKNVSVEPYGSASLDFTVTPKKTGFIKGYVELEHDAIEPDNKRFFSISIPDRVNIAIVAHTTADIQYLTLALQASAADGNQSLLHIDQTTEQQFSLLNIRTADVLICANVSSFSSNDVERIKSFVGNGGGLILFPGNDLQLNNYNTTLFPALNIPPGGNVVKTPGEQTALSFDKIDLDHPLFATIYERELRGKNHSSQTIESPAITTTLQHLTGKQGQTLITLNNGSAFLSEYSSGNGKILLYSVPPNLTWSDFPLKGIFAPLMHRSVMYAAALNGSQETYTAGNDAAISLNSARNRSAENQYRVIAPDGVEELIQLSSQKGSTSSTSFLLHHLEQPGWYELRNGKTLLSLVAVNTDNRESDTRSISDADLETFWKHYNIPASSVKLIENTDQFETTILQSRFGVELWKYCIGIALLLALFEMMIARDSRQATLQPIG